MKLLFFSRSCKLSNTKNLTTHGVAASIAGNVTRRLVWEHEEASATHLCRTWPDSIYRTSEEKGLNLWPGKVTFSKVRLCILYYWTFQMSFVGVSRGADVPARAEADNDACAQSGQSGFKVLHVLDLGLCRKNRTRLLTFQQHQLRAILTHTLTYSFTRVKNETHLKWKGTAFYFDLLMYLSQATAMSLVSCPHNNGHKDTEENNVVARR